MNMSTRKKHEIDWKVNLPKPFPVVWLIIGAIGIAHFIIDLSFFSINPFIRSVHDLPHPKSNWIFDTGLLPQNWVYIALVVSFLALMYTLYTVFHAFFYSEVSENEGEDRIKKRRAITIKWWFKPSSKIDRAALVLFLATAILTSIEIIWIKSFQNHTLVIIALWMRCATGIFSLGVVLAAFINDYLKHIRKYISYFYPSIASIAILGFALIRVDQTNSLIIDLLDSPLNFIFFSLLFTVSIILVWYSPSYLLFTDEFFDDRKNLENFKLYHHEFNLDKNLFFKLIHRHKDFLTDLVKKIDEGKKITDAKIEAQKHQTGIASANIEKDPLESLFAYKDIEPKDFTIIRRLLGLSYIIVLVSLTSKVIADVYSMGAWFRPVVILTSIVLPLIAWHVFHRQIKNKKRIREITTGLVITFFVLQFGCLLIVWLWNWEAALTSLLITVLLSSVIFILIAAYRTAKQLMERTPGYKEKYLDNIKEYLDNFNKWATSRMLTVNYWVGQFALFFWLLLLLLPLSLEYLQFINPINIYLLLVNGLIAYITVIDRHLTIRNKMQKIASQIKAENGEKEQGSNIISNTKYHYRTWAFVAIIALIGAYFSKAGNSFHEIEYISSNEFEAEQYDSYQSLEEYTQQFMHKLGVICDEEQIRKDCESDPSVITTKKDTAALCCNHDTTEKPVILIASDGGGLKAAYWTMLILHRLDSLGLYNNNVFIMSGASGGSIGMGMYTYLKAQGLNLDEIHNKIEALASTNFLSTDFAGLLGKFPINYLPDFYGIHEWKDSEDRMDAMSKAYFTIANQSPELHHAVLEAFPYSYLWNKALEEENGYQLPLFILNSAKADDGTKGWVHPFQEDAFLAAGIVDLSKQQHGDHTAYISYPDALFLTNRFPFLSPAGKIEGEGHFVDVGAVENSGLGTIAQILNKMQAKQDEVAAYQAFFQQNLIVLSLRNAKSRYIKDKFNDDVQYHLNRSISKSEISAFFNSVVQAGMTGAPKKLDEVYDENGEAGVNFKLTFKKINLPFLIDSYDPHYVFQNQITRDLSGKVDTLNNEIYKLFDCEGHDCWKAIVPPPLGRLVVEPSRAYTKLMLNHPDTKVVFDSLAVLKTH